MLFSKYLFLFLLSLLLVFAFQNCSPLRSNTGQTLDLGSAEKNDELKLFLRCSSSDFRSPKPSMLKKLTVIEIENSLYDIFEKWLSTSAANQIITHTKPFLSAIPKEKSLEGMNNSDQSVSKQHVEAYVELADQVGFFIENNIELKKQLLQCPIPANDSCIKSFISKFGRDVLRKPLEQGDIDWFYSTYSKSPNKPFQNLVASLFSSPQFIYLLEFGDQLAQPDYNFPAQLFSIINSTGVIQSRHFIGRLLI